MEQRKIDKEDEREEKKRREQKLSHRIICSFKFIPVTELDPTFLMLRIVSSQSSLVWIYSILPLILSLELSQRIAANPWLDSLFIQVQYLSEGGALFATEITGILIRNPAQGRKVNGQ